MVRADQESQGFLNTFFDGERVARRDGATGAGAVFYYFSDHLKTASVITDSVGVIKAESDYYPWGGELQFVNNDSNDYKFTGKKRDVETGLDYFGARYYSNELGRWVSADWSAMPVPVPYANFGDPQSLNLYGFVGGNPASKADVDGHECAPCEIAMKEIDKVAKPLIESAGGAITKGGSAFLRVAGTVGGVVSILFTSTPAASRGELEYERKIRERNKDAQATAGGSGARNGGGKSTAVSPGPDGMKNGSSDPNGAGKPFNKSVKDGARAESENKCVFCGKNTTREPGPDQSNIDHANAKSEGGDNSPENAQNTCRTCNQDKGTRSTDEYLQHRQDNPQKYNREPH